MGEPGRERAFRVIELLAARQHGAALDHRRLHGGAAEAVPGAARRGPRRRGRPDAGARARAIFPLIRNLSRIGYRDLLRSGVRIYEWDGPMLHAKTIVSDGRWVRIGSSNLNPSSLIGNYELDVLIEDPSLAESMERQFRLDIGRSREVHRRPLRGPRRISEALPTALTRDEPEVGLRPLPPAPARDPPPRRPRRSGPSRATHAARSSSHWRPFSSHSACCSSPCRARRRTSSARSAPGWRSAPGGRRFAGGRIGEADRRTGGRAVTYVTVSEAIGTMPAWSPSLRSG